MVDAFLKEVSKSGTPLGFNWEQVKAVILSKFDQVSKSYEAEKPISSLEPVPNVDNYSYQEYCERIKSYLDRFEDSPFTIGRICELLLEPRKHYDRSDKFLRAFEKCVAVTSTNTNPDMEMNGVETVNQGEPTKQIVDNTAENGLATKDSAQNGHSEAGNQQQEQNPVGGEEKSDNSVSSSVEEVNHPKTSNEDSKVESSTASHHVVGNTEADKESSNGEAHPKEHDNGEERVDAKRQLDEPDTVAKKIARLENGSVGGVDLGEPDVEPRVEKNGHDKEGQQDKVDVGKDAVTVDQDVVGEGTAV